MSDPRQTYDSVRSYNHSRDLAARMLKAMDAYKLSSVVAGAFLSPVSRPLMDALIAEVQSRLEQLEGIQLAEMADLWPIGGDSETNQET